MNQTARMLVDMLNAEAMSQVRVSYGNPVSEIKSVSRSYKEAKMALEVGKFSTQTKTWYHTTTSASAV